MEEANNSELPQILENADTIELHKVFLHPNTKFNVYIDKNKVGTITRNNKIFSGKTFKLRDLAGNVIGYETEEKRFFSFNRSATFFDFKNNKTLYIKEHKEKNISNLDLEYRYTIYNSYNEEIGFTKSQFLSLIKRKHSINNFENEALYNIEKSCLFPKRYTIKVNNISSEVSALDATLYAAINDSIISKTNNSSSKKSKK